MPTHAHPCTQTRRHADTQTHGHTDTDTHTAPHKALGAWLQTTGSRITPLSGIPDSVQWGFRVRFQSSF